MDGLKASAALAVERLTRPQRHQPHPVPSSRRLQLRALFSVSADHHCLFDPRVIHQIVL